MSRSSAAFEPYPDPGEIWGYLEDRFGLERDRFARHRLWWRAGDKREKPVWIVHEDCAPPVEVKVDWVGLCLMRQPPPRGFPTSAFLRRFGAPASRNVVDVDWDTGLRLMYNHQIEHAPLDDKGGPYIVRAPRTVLGRGWVRKGRLILDTPKGWPNQLMPRTELAEVGEAP
ncbi:MAG: hypothetical protein ACLFP7_03750 [Thiohalospira sp.]